jgi:hypothetical protein
VPTNWLEGKRDALSVFAGDDFHALLALLPERGYAPDFLTPPPSSPIANLDAELESVRLTPRARVAEEIDRALATRPIQSGVERILRTRTVAGGGDLEDAQLPARGGASFAPRRGLGSMTRFARPDDGSRRMTGAAG